MMQIDFTVSDQVGKDHNVRQADLFMKSDDLEVHTTVTGSKAVVDEWVLDLPIKVQYFYHLLDISDVEEPARGS